MNNPELATILSLNINTNSVKDYNEEIVKELEFLLKEQTIICNYSNNQNYNHGQKDMLINIIEYLKYTI